MAKVTIKARRRSEDDSDNGEFECWDYDSTVEVNGQDITHQVADIKLAYELSGENAGVPVLTLKIYPEELTVDLDEPLIRRAEESDEEQGSSAVAEE